MPHAPQPYDAALVEARLLEAGRTLMALQVPGCRPAGYRSGMPDFVREFDESYGWDGSRPRASVPGAREIAAMEQALSWIRLIPSDRVVFRRIVGARMLCRPHQDRPLLSWRRIAEQVGASHEAVRAWHGQAIGLVVAALNRPGLCAAARGSLGPGPAPVRQTIERARTAPVRGRALVEA